MPKIVSIKNVGKHRAFDLEVDHPDHQFYLENGLLTSNSHSAAYSALTMTNAILATYHPLEFYSALLTRGQAGDLQDYVSDIKKSGVKVLPVDINQSKAHHVVQDGAIRLSLSSVNGVGASGIAKITANQPYTDWFDFLKRSGATKTVISPLILAGAFDPICPNMKRVECWYKVLLDDPKLKNVKRWDEYVDICESIDADDYQLHEKVAFENELMGFSLRGSPFEILDRKKKIEDLFGDKALGYREFLDGEEEVAMLPVVVKDVKERADRKKNMMAWVKFGVETGEEFEAPAFSTVWKHIGAGVKRGCVYVATFNRKPDEPESLIIGRPGWAHSAHSAAGYMINVDELEVG